MPAVWCGALAAMPPAWASGRNSSNGVKEQDAASQQHEQQQQQQQGTQHNNAAHHAAAPQQQQQQQASANARPAAIMEDAALFSTPQDLICPITHELLLDPVITTVGQVYERSAIERHLQRCLSSSTLGTLTDPVTNLPLPSAQLLPVHPMRSRAMEYRETAAKACVERAAAAVVPDPVTYLRRAAELLAPCYGSTSSSSGRSSSGGRASRDEGGVQPGVGFSGAACSCRVAGMSPDFARYLVTHQGPAYEALALKYFANELRRGGHIDQAAAVLYRLLLGADGDCQQQKEYLELCLDCWAASSSSNNDSNGNDGSNGNENGLRQLAPEPELVNKLADFVVQQRGFTPGQMLDMLSGARLGKKLLLALVEELLTRSTSSGDSSGSGGNGSSRGNGSDSRRSTRGSLDDGGGAVGAVAGGSDLAHHKDLLVRYVRLSMAELGEEFESLEARLEGQQGQKGHQRLKQQHQQEQQQEEQQQGQGGKQQQRRGGLRWWGTQARALRHSIKQHGGRVAASAVLTTASLVGGNHPLVRVARLAPLMWLLHQH